MNELTKDMRKKFSYEYWLAEQPATFTGFYYPEEKVRLAVEELRKEIEKLGIPFKEDGVMYQYDKQARKRIYKIINEQFPVFSGVK